MRYVILGSSAAGVNGAKEIRKLDPNGEIIMISKDETIYSRCILHHYMSRHRTMNRLRFVEGDFFERYRIKWVGGTEAIGLNAEKKEVYLSNGETVGYDKLLIGTGSNSFFPPIENMNKAKNVLGFRNIDDCIEIMEKIDKLDNIVIMGGGLVGVDALIGLIDSKKNLYLVEMQDRLLSIQLDKRAAKTYEDAFRRRGVNFYFGVGAQKLNLHEEDNIKSLTLSNGEEIPCELLIVTAGVRANIGFLKDSTIEVDKKGLIIDRSGRTNDSDVYGAGDVTGRGPIWPVAVKEGVIAGSNMVGVHREMTDFFTSKSTMNFFGIPTMSLGINEPLDSSYSVEIEEDIKGNYKKVIHKDGKIYGAILQGDLSYAGVLTQLIRENIDISKVKKPIFKIDYSDFFNITDNFEFSYE
ncbi:NAD(P)H-dependent nitrate reductase diaphorase subunit [Tissierella praeacuta DSM 18095]|uniref:NAD(P)H-dependent nitrate reductase diaphorase subunit n=1 Tax=Tissierella praeacuta DSM 18095 TaxID=1123404 RepID=A0A1M4XMT3_9FIRM|nr:FAD-dependent oxidoreductase [Tissierella praeacuta]SHE94904.1 NAD(P)H-dependent nitrate reductase diaphorase subunit [Tissierella praeacuta DSM 18095]SUO99824.1 Rubredoxin-NAD(+) reductase [Tissierella praeacuta]